MKGFYIRLAACTLAIVSVGSGFDAAKAQLASNDAQNFPVEIIPSTMGGWSKPIFTANGRLAVLGNGNGAQLWDLQKNRLVRTFTGLGTINTIAALSPDGTRIAAGAGKVIDIWNIATGRIEATLNLLLGTINSIVFSRDGTRLIYAGTMVGRQPTVVIAEISSGRVIKSFFETYDVQTLDLSPDGQLIAFAGFGGAIHIIDGNGRPVRTLTDQSNGRVKDLAFSSDGTLLATGGNDGAAKIWDVSSGKLLRTLPGHAGPLHLVHSVSWSPDGTLLATTDGANLRIWNTRTGVLEAKRPFELSAGNPAFVSLATFTPDGKSLLVDANGIKQVSVDKQEVLAELGGVGSYSEFVKGVKIVDDQVYFAAGYPRTVSSFDFSTRKIHEALRSGTERDGWSYIAGSKDGMRFIGVDNGNLLYFDSAVSNQPKILMTGLKDCYVTAMSPSGDLAAVGNGPDAMVIETKSGNIVKRFKADAPYTSGPTQLVFSNDGRVLVAAFIGNVVRVLQLSSGNIVATTKLDTYETISISPDSKTVLISSTERNNLTVDYRALDGLRLLSRLRIPGGESNVQPANFDPTGKLAIVGSFDGLLRLWDLSSGTMIRTFRGHAGPISEAQFISSGRKIVSSANDGFRIWDTNSGELLATYLFSSGSEWLAITPEGFFDASDKGSKTLSIVRGLDVFSIDQFYDKLHRPDLVQQKLIGDPEGKVKASSLQLSLPKAVASGNAPIVTITSPATHATTADTKLVVEVSVVDQGGGVGKIEWRVNGTTLGVSLESNGVSTSTPATYRKALSLVAGDNRIEVIAYNSQGLISSDPAVATVNVAQQQDFRPPQLHVLAVGVNDYWDSKLRLSFAVPDAKSISDSLQEAGKRLYDKIDVTTVLDAEATAYKLDQTFDELSRRVRPQDVFVFFMSGHGKTVDGRFYFIPQDFRYSNEDSIIKSGINQDQLQRWFARIPAQKSLLLFDACESGALIGDRIATRGMEDKTAIDLMSRSVGRTVLTATTDDKPAAEGYRGHGVFTYALLTALAGADANNDGVIDILELADFVDREVPTLTYDAWKMRQVPQMKIVGSNFPLVSRTTVLLPRTEAAVVPASPTHVVISQTPVRQTADEHGPTLFELTAGTQIRVIETSGELAVVARDGKKLGYVDAKALATLH